MHTYVPLHHGTSWTTLLTLPSEAAAAAAAAEAPRGGGNKKQNRSALLLVGAFTCRWEWCSHKMFYYRSVSFIIGVKWNRAIFLSASAR